MIRLLILLFIFPLSLLASSGDGAGNGGMGYHCNLMASNQKVTLTLDTAEKLTAIYSKNYFYQFDLQNKTLTNQIISIIDKADSSHTARPLYVKALKEIANSILNISEIQKLKLFSNNELSKIRKAKDYLLNDTYLYIHLKKYQAPEIRTFDLGKVNLPSQVELQEYGLADCRLVQIAVYGYIDMGAVGTVHALRFHGNHFYYMDDMNLKALLWHEVIYQALEDNSSLRTRNLVAKIVQKLY